MNKLGISLKGLVLICIILALSVGPMVDSYAARVISGGSAFSDPNLTQTMPDKWKEKTVTHKNADLVITLDQHLYSAILPLINRFASKNNLKILVHKGTCGISAGKLEKKAVDIGGFCCPPGKTDRLPGIRFHTIGISPIVLLTHPDNPLENISLEQARGVFSGKIKRWLGVPEYKEKGGRDFLIMPITRLHCKNRPGHWRLLIDNEDMLSPSIQEVGAIADMIRLVSSNTAAIGYEVPWMTRAYKDHGKVKMLYLNNLDPRDNTSIVSGKYPLYRVYNITTWNAWGLTNKISEKLAEYLVQEAETIESKFGIIPSSHLRQSGWQFKRNELVGEPR